MFFDWLIFYQHDRRLVLGPARASQKCCLLRQIFFHLQHFTSANGLIWLDKDWNDQFLKWSSYKISPRQKLEKVCKMSFKLPPECILTEIRAESGVWVMSMFAKICYIKTCPFILWREIWVFQLCRKAQTKINITINFIDRKDLVYRWPVMDMH